MANYYNNHSREMEVECDQCGEESVYFGEYMDCIDDAKEDGWVIYKEGRTWIHLCSEECKRNKSTLDDFLNQ